MNTFMAIGRRLPAAAAAVLLILAGLTSAAAETECEELARANAASTACDEGEADLWEVDLQIPEALEWDVFESLEIPVTAAAPQGADLEGAVVNLHVAGGHALQLPEEGGIVSSALDADGQVTLTLSVAEFFPPEELAAATIASAGILLELLEVRLEENASRGLAEAVSNQTELRIAPAVPGVTLEAPDDAVDQGEDADLTAEVTLPEAWPDEAALRDFFRPRLLALSAHTSQEDSGFSAEGVLTLYAAADADQQHPLGEVDLAEDDSFAAEFTVSADDLTVGENEFIAAYSGPSYFTDAQSPVATVMVSPTWVTAEPPSFDEETGQIDVPVVEGIEYLVDGTVTEGLTLAPGQTAEVFAQALHGYAIEEGSEAAWSFAREPEQAEPSPTPEPTESEQPSPEPTVTETPLPSSEPPSPEPSESDAPTPEPSVSESPSPVPSESEAPSPEPSVSETPSPAPSESEAAAPGPTPSEAPPPSAEPSETQTPSPEASVPEGASPAPTASESPALDPSESASPSPTPDPETPSPEPSAPPGPAESGDPLPSAEPAGPETASPLPSDQPRLSLELVDDEILAGGMIEGQATGYAPGTEVAGTMHSDPVVLGTVVADDAGIAEFSWQIPAGAEPGPHTLVLSAEEHSDASAPFRVLVAEPSDSSTQEPAEGPSQSQGSQAADSPDSGAAPASASGGAESSAGSDELARTGPSGPAGWSLLAGLALLLGLIALTISRRRLTTSGRSSN
ncbi:hypothetical protein [Nesterenkonia populi]